MTRAGRRVATLALCVLALLVLPVAASGAGPIPGTNGAAVPTLDWDGCPAETPEEAEALAEYECSVAEVPLSYADPDGPTIQLALGRLPATDQSRKLGSLFWNPGGPGGSGRIPPPFSPALHERFDLVGFDPRGIAASTPLRCFNSNEQAIRLFGSDFPITPAQERRFIRQHIRGTERCDRNAGPIIEHMSTANVARDLDLLRQAVGDDALSYLGFSYGTAVGEYYANLFPDNVRALTLDAVIDPTEWSSDSTVTPVEYRLGSFFGSRQALDTFLAECTADIRCAFREPGVDLRRKYDRLLARVRRAPVELDLGEPVPATYQFVVYNTLGALYQASASPDLAALLQLVWEATERPSALAEPPAESEPGSGFQPVRAAGRQEEPYFGLEWLPAVECTDSTNPTDPLAWPRWARVADRQAGPFGSPWVFFSQSCATWPARDPDRYTGPWNQPTDPILLVGNSQGDPATPYEDARQTERVLANARLLTLDSFGHTAQGGLSSCIDEAIDRYLIDLQLPPRGLVCQPDRRPFDPLPAALARKRKQRAELFPQLPGPVVPNR